MTPALQFEILDLRHFSAANLRPLLDAESRIWSQRLEWDYRPSANLLLQYLDSRVLPGYVALENGRVSGYAFCVYEDRKAVIGDVFALLPQNIEITTTEVESRLIQNLLELLQNSPGIDRIESQLLLHPHGQLSHAFTAAGFSIHKRLFMRRDLLIRVPPAKVNAYPDLEMRPWREDDFNAASSRILMRRSTKECIGLVLCSRVREDVAHITQLCIAKEARGRGLGSLLIEESAISLRAEGFRALTLTVTAENKSAVSLYQRSEFNIVHDFDAMLWENSNR